MLCPYCDDKTYCPGIPCSECDFDGDPQQVIELTHIEWLLKEIPTWANLRINESLRNRLVQKYTKQLYELEISLNLRYQPFTHSEAQNAWPEFIHHESLLKQISIWETTEQLAGVNLETAVAPLQARLAELRERLTPHRRPHYPSTTQQKVDTLDFQIKFVENNIPEAAQAQLLSNLLAERNKLVKHSTGQADQQPLAATTSANKSAQPTKPPEPRVPFRERLWEALLSERTLYAMMILGVFLMFAAAMSFVFLSGQEFSPLVRVAVLTGFTGLFFGLGWYIRTQTPLYRSGIACSATAALLIPINFYTIYDNFDIPLSYRSEFWLASSIFCLIFYLINTLRTQSRFFGYLVAVAAGSTMLAMNEIGHESIGLSRDWQTAGLSMLALGLILLAAPISRLPQTHAWRVFADPFRTAALLAVGVLMPLTFGWRYLLRDGYDVLHQALTLNWWFGGLAFGWAAIYYRSRGLGLLAAAALPMSVYLAQAGLFHQFGINPAWHGVGFALLTPLYLIVGRRLMAHSEDEVIRGHGRTAIGWGLVLLLVATFWPLTDLSSGAAAACSHAILSLTVAIAALLWRRPHYLYGASLLAFSATSFTMTELAFTLPQLSVGWAMIAIIHLLLALKLHLPYPIPMPNFVSPLVRAGYTIAAAAVVAPLFPYNNDLTMYALGNWIGLSAWGAYLAHKQQSGFVRWRKPIVKVDHAAAKEQAVPTPLVKPQPYEALPFQWLAALPLPIWVAVLFDSVRPLDFTLPLALTAVAWGMVNLGYRLAQIDGYHYRPWRIVGGLTSLTAPFLALMMVETGFTPAIVLLAIGLLYFADTITGRHRDGFIIAGATLAAGYILFLHRLEWLMEPLLFGLALWISLYLLIGLIMTWRKPVIDLHTNHFWQPWYVITHVMTALTIGFLYLPAVREIDGVAEWTDPQRLWAAASQMVLALVYGLYAWRRQLRFWAHSAIWLMVAGGGLIAITFSSGRGSSAAKAAVGAIALILLERGLRWAWSYSARPRHHRALIRLTWRLYEQPLLVVGWTISAITIGLAVWRNLVLLGGGFTRQVWSIVALLLIVGLYALSGYLFRRSIFVWLAATLMVVPWTLLTDLGWFTGYQPSLPQFALSWLVLAWAMFGLSHWVSSRGLKGTAVKPLSDEGIQTSLPTTALYPYPLRIVANVIVPLSLIWAMGDLATSCLTLLIAIAFYGLAAYLHHHQYQLEVAAPHQQPAAVLSRLQQLTRRLPSPFYPMIALIPIWASYLMAWSWPTASNEQHGLLLLLFGSLGLLAGQGLGHVAPLAPNTTDSQKFRQQIWYGLPAYLPTYVCLTLGTLLMSESPRLLGSALLYDAALLTVSAWLFHSWLWLFLAGLLVPLSMLIFINEADVALRRQGWWLIGLAATYYLVAWQLNRLKPHQTSDKGKQSLPKPKSSRVRPNGYSLSLIVIGFGLMNLGLIPSSVDQTGAVWGYSSVVILYVILAFSLKQPLLLWPACLLTLVPHGVLLHNLNISWDYLGLSLYPLALTAIGLGWALDAHYNQPTQFPWNQPSRWVGALLNYLVRWWGLPLTTLGLGLATLSPLFTVDFRYDLTALALLLLMAIYGWATYRFRLREWLFALAVAGHLAAASYLQWLGWWQYADEGWRLLLPVTGLTLFVAFIIEKLNHEGAPLEMNRLFKGWSRPLYALVAFDMLIAQLVSLNGTAASSTVTLIHALLLGLLVCAWQAPKLAYLSLLMGTFSLWQWFVVWQQPLEQLSVGLAQLMLVYGIIGYGLSLYCGRVISPPYQRFLNPNKDDDDADNPAPNPTRSLPMWVEVWEKPLQQFSLFYATGLLILTLLQGMPVIGWTSGIILGMIPHRLADYALIWMLIGIFSWIGLLYLIASTTYRSLRLGYISLGLLLTAWMLYLFYMQQWVDLARMHWYTVPVGGYLLVVSYIERQRNRPHVARWLDYFAIGLMLGSLFWQVLLFGWQSMLLMLLVGMALFFWGSGRRLRRLLYAGMVGVMLATLGQLINSLGSINQWMVFGVVGLMLIVLVMIAERKMEQIKTWRDLLEAWE